MKILLDENLPHALRVHLLPHEAYTTRFLGWSGWKNGTLLQAAEDAGFEILLTADQNMTYQQSLRGKKIAVVALWTLLLPDLLLHLDAIRLALARAKAGESLFVVPVKATEA